MNLFTKNRLLFSLLLALLFSANAKAQITFTFSSPTVDSADRGYILAGVGAYYKSTGRSSISTGTIDCNGSTISASSGGGGFIFETYVNDIVGIIVYGQGTGSNRTFTSLSTSTSIGGTYTPVTTAASADVMENSGTCDSLLITTGTPINAGTYMQLSFSGNINVTSIVLLSSASFSAPTVLTVSPSAITFNSAISGGNITSDGNSTVTSRGTLYSTSVNPQIAGPGVTQIIDPGTGTGAYSASLTSLLPSTLYHVQAYATNAIGTSYGGDSTFTTPAATPTLTVTPSTLSFGNVVVNKTSTERTYSVSGAYLNAGPGNITVTAPAGYQVSLTTGTGYGSSVSIPYTGTTLAATTIYVVLQPTAVVAYSGNISSIGGGAAEQDVAVTGNGAPVGLQLQSAFSNIGTDFWTGFGPHEKSNGADGSNSNAEMTLYFTSADTGTVNIYVGNSLVQTLSLATPNSITASNLIPWSGTTDARLLVDSLYIGKGIHITSTTPMVAYAEIWGSQVTAATVLFPTNTLGRSYTALIYDQASNDEGTVQDRSYVFAVATQDSTTVQATLPPGITSGSGLTGTNSKVLNKGDVWLITAADGVTDITGTEIKSISTNGSACNPIAVFSGTGKIDITCTGSTASGDNLFQQNFPYVAWGKNYVSAPTGGAGYSFNTYRVMLNPDSAANTTVTINGVALSPAGTVVPGLSSTNPVTAGAPIALTNGLYYEFGTSSPVVISSSSPVMVAQYITNSNNACTNDYNGGKTGDPDMIYLSPVEQTINNVIVAPVNTQNGNSVNYINVVIATVDVPNFTITPQVGGTTQAPAFTPIGDGTYSYWQDSIAQGYNPGVNYTLASTGGGFNAVAYGYSKSESYAYNAGTSLNDLSSAISVQNQYGTGSASSVCRGGNFNMKVLLPYQSTAEIIFNYSNNPNLTPNKPDTILNPVYDTSYVLNGITLYEYVNPNPHVYSLIGNLPVIVDAQNPTSDGCSLTEFPFSIAVTQGPVANFSFPTQSGCSGTVQFTDASLGNGGTVNKWVWNYGDGTGTFSLTPPDSSIQNPTHIYNTGGTFNVKLRAITDKGCYADTTRQVVFSSALVSGFTVDHDTICVNSSITFTDTSSIQSGTITQRVYDFGDGSPLVTLTTATPQTHNYPAANTYTVSLTVTSSSGCTVFASKQVTVSPMPDVTFTALDPVCSNGSVIDLTTLVTPQGGTFSGLSGVTGTTFNPATAPTGIDTITYTYTSAGGCIVVKKQPITVNSSTPLVITPINALCVNGSPVSLAGTPAGGSFTIDGVAATAFDPTAAGVGSHQVIYSSGGCSKADTIQVTVSALPSIDAGGPGLVASPNSPVTINASKDTGSYTFLWSPTDGLSSATVLNPQASPGQQTLYTLTATTANAAKCTASDTVTVFVNIPCTLTPPKVFTPNGDGRNELWKISPGCATNIVVSVYNRWGSLVYHSDHYNNDWDGTYKGDALPDGTYYYVIQSTENGRTYSMTGNVTIMR